MTAKPRYTIVTAAGKAQLIAAVDVRLADDVWQCEGAPFYDGDARQWCQAISRRGPDVRPGEVKIRESRRS